MKKLYVVITLFLLILCVGCQNNKYVDSTTTENVNESSAEEREQIAPNSDDKNFSLSANKIVNLNEVTKRFDWSYLHGLTCDYEVEVRLEDYFVPEEIIEILISANDGDSTNDELYKNNLSDSNIAINLEDLSNTEFGNSIYYDLVKNRGIINTIQVDIDYDSEYEYLVEYYEGTDGYTAVSVFKKVEGEMKEIYYIFEEDSCYKLLELNDRYYILAGDCVAYFDTVMGSWHSVNVSRTVTNFDKFEFYSQAQLEENTIFENIDLVHKENWERQDAFNYEFICGMPLALEQQIEGETYYYVCTDFRNHEHKNRDDRLLFIIKENTEENFEIIKAYYLVAKVKLVVE